MTYYIADQSSKTNMMETYKIEADSKAEAKELLKEQMPHIKRGAMYFITPSAFTNIIN